jgi:CheY-like chemotaxis protein
MDDEEMVGGVSEQIMENIDYKVLLARKGKEDMEVYKANKDEIAMIMPGMDIGETYDRIREINPK